MALFRLPGGTDVAEVALFDLDAVPRSRGPDSKTLAGLAADEHLIRVPTGADGGYLLHLYIDQPAPEHIKRCCLADDTIVGGFTAGRGRIAFGGVESAYADYKPNLNIRADADIEAGRYAYVVYRTDYPNGLVEDTIDIGLTARERWLDRSPVIAMVTSLILAYLLAILRQFLAAGAVLALGYFVARSLSRSVGFREIAARRREAARDLPSIVIELRPTGTHCTPPAAAHIER